VSEDRDERLDRELIELLNELRVALPGVQVLFAFLLTVPFSNGWQRVTDLQRDVYFLTLLLATTATILLIAPSSYHRLRWREHDKERMLVTANRLAIAGTAFLALAMTCALFLIADVLFDQLWAGVVAAAAGGGFAWFWYGLPLSRRARSR
jgi:hypothetical protein